MLATCGSVLTAIWPDGTRHVIHPALGYSRVWYCNLPDGRTTYSNGLIHGVTDGLTGAARSVPMPASLGVADVAFGALHPGEYRYHLTYVRLSDRLEGPAISSEKVTISQGGLRLDGLPLAIEMAAAWIPAIGLPALLARVDERLDLLQNPDPEAPPRQRSLRAVLDWSHSLLTPAERRALRRLAELPDRFGLDEARQAMAADALDEWQALETLTALCDKSLVMIDAGEATRYRLPETGRLYVRAA